MADEKTIERRRTGGAGFARRFVEVNYFYLLSAMLIILGCWLMMPDHEEEGERFSRTLTSLLILQGYELLVIAAAVWIVSRLKFLSDAFTLMVVELVLLFDPTFFSNSFFTLGVVEGMVARCAWVNAGCLALAPLKLWLLARLLHLRLAPGTWVGLSVAAAVVYLAEGPLALDRPLEFHAAYLYGLAWRGCRPCWRWSCRRPRGRRRSNRRGRIMPAPDSASGSGGSLFFSRCCSVTPIFWNRRRSTRSGCG
jgi:hypothetical protein